MNACVDWPQRSDMNPSADRIHMPRRQKRRGLAVWVVGLVAATSTLGLAQKVVGPDEFDRAMKTIGTAIASVRKAVGSEA